ncbi:MAG: DUF6171 family protein [Treponema sp.]|nr:DUF6171 family protein [Treponema sp.]
MNRIPCARCGEGILPGPEQAAELAAAIPIAPSLRAAAEVYAARLEKCGDCGSLREGVLCSWCGCFVRFRARIKGSCCPDPKGDRWNN